MRNYCIALALISFVLLSCTAKESTGELFFLQESYSYTEAEAIEGVMLEVDGDEKTIKNVRWRVPTDMSDAVVIGFPEKGKMEISFKHKGEFDIDATSGGITATAKIIVR